MLICWEVNFVGYFIYKLLYDDRFDKLYIKNVIDICNLLICEKVILSEKYYMVSIY